MQPRTRVVRADPDFFRPPVIDLDIRALELDIWGAPSWSIVLNSAGKIDGGSRLFGINEKSLPNLRIGKKRQFFIINFGRFVASGRAFALARGEGYRPAHPRALAAAATQCYDLPVKLKHPLPMSLTTLVPCYRDGNEDYVMRVTWDKQMQRTVDGVYYSYGWEPEYWLLFEEIPRPKAVQTR